MITSIDQLDLDKTYTYADYLTWRLEEYVELIRGKIFRMSPSPNREHQRVSRRLTAYFLPFFEQGDCELFIAPMDVRLFGKAEEKDTLTVVQPDLFVVCDPSKMHFSACFGAPDFIVEILSPSTSRKDVTDKYDLYQEAGVREYWIVDPVHHLLEQHVLERGKFTFKGRYGRIDAVKPAIFPELSIDLERVFSS